MQPIEAAPARGLNARAQALLSRIAYRRALDEDERDAIFRLRHDAYLREGAIEARPCGRFADAVDDQDNAFLFGVYVDGALAGAIRMNVTLPGARALPTAGVFPEFVGPRVAAGETIVDPTRFVARPSLAGRLPELPYLTVRLVWLAAEHFAGDWILIAVRPEHRAFYRRYWSAVEVCEPRPYPRLAKPVGLSVVDYPAVRERVVARHPFLASTAAERAALFGPPVARGPEHDVAAALWQREPAPAGLGLPR